MISVIVPVYEAEKFIEECVKSIQRQTFTDWELLLINNGSTDQSPRICEELSRQDGRIRFFHFEENRGVSHARNQGLLLAKGEWITFVDADDLVWEDYLEVLWNLKNKHWSDMVICGYERMLPEEREERRQRAKETVSGKAYLIEDYFAGYLLEGNTHCWGILYSKDRIQNLHFPQGISIGEDLLFLIEAALLAEKIVVTDYCGYRYFINRQGAMERPFTLSYMDQITCWQKAEDRLLPLFPGLESKLTGILLVSVLLVVGKLAVLDRKERKCYQSQQTYCSDLIKKYSQKKGGFSVLSSNDALKVRFYHYLPRLYLMVYGLWKGGRRLD